MQNTVAAGFVAASVSRSSPGRTATPLQGVGAGHASVLAVIDAGSETFPAAS